jgi:hypothetical protein
MVTQYCGAQLPGYLVYGIGRRPPNGVRLASKGSARSLPHVHHGGMRYGADFHRRGLKSRYGYIEGRHPVLIKRIYHSKLVIPADDHNEERERMIVCVIVRRFRNAVRQAVFPWDHR